MKVAKKKKEKKDKERENEKEKNALTKDTVQKKRQTMSPSATVQRSRPETRYQVLEIHICSSLRKSDFLHAAEPGS